MGCLQLFLISASSALFFIQQFSGAYRWCFILHLQSRFIRPQHPRSSSVSHVNKTAAEHDGCFPSLVVRRDNQNATKTSSLMFLHIRLRLAVMPHRNDNCFLNCFIRRLSQRSKHREGIQAYVSSSNRLGVSLMQSWNDTCLLNCFIRRSKQSSKYYEEIQQYVFQALVGGIVDATLDRAVSQGGAYRSRHGTNLSALRNNVTPGTRRLCSATCRILTVTTTANAHTITSCHTPRDCARATCGKATIRHGPPPARAATAAGLPTCCTPARCARPRGRQPTPD
jgi:hypothetical protein